MKNTQSPEQFETAHLEKLRTQLSSDIELLQQKEANMRDHEQRLRVLIASSATVQPALAAPVTHYGSARQAEADLDAAWEKYHRANALLEAARRGLMDDRLALRDLDERLRLREEEVSRRESWVKAREAELQSRPAPGIASGENPITRAKSSLTAMPFMMAKNLLSPRRT